MTGSRSHVAALGTAQTVAWASSFYLPAMLAAPMAREFGRPASSVFGLLSIALVLAALLSPWAGRVIDRRGGRPVLLSSTALFMLALVTMALAPNLAVLAAGWLVLGLAMGCGLYDAAFATLVRQLGTEARRAISGITLVAGFASTVGWPLSALMSAHWGWRGACLGWAALHLLVALPLYLWLLPRGTGAATAATAASAATFATPASVQAGTAQQTQAPTQAAGRRTLGLVVVVFTLWSVVSTSVATHLPSVLQAAGLSLAAAVAVAALVGPSQVVARLMELALLGRVSALFTARLAALGHPLAAACVLLAGPIAALPFVVLHGLGNGLLTIVRGTLPLALLGAHGYGARQGWISLPGRLLGAASPWVLGLLLERHGVAALGLTAGLAGAALALLLLLRLPPAAAPR